MVLFLLKRLIGAVVLIYMVMIITRVVGSWFPGIETHPLMHYLAVCTDPYLNLFQRFVPKVGGFNVSPLAALLTLGVAKWVVA